MRSMFAGLGAVLALMSAPLSNPAIRTGRGKRSALRRSNGPSKYRPHQGYRECARRRRQMDACQLTGSFE